MRYSPIQNRYLNILLAILLAGLFTFSSLPPSPHALAEGASNVTLTSATIATVNGTATTDLIVNGANGPSGLAAYMIEIVFDRTKVRVVSVEGYSPFGSVTSNINASNPATDANTIGTVKMNSFHANATGPTGTVRLATITWTALAAGTFPLTLTKLDLNPVSGAVMDPAPVLISGTITVTAQPGTTPVPATATPAPTTPPPATPGAVTPTPATPGAVTPAPATPPPTTGPTTVPIATSTPSSAPTPAGTYVEAGSSTVAPNASVQIPVSVKNITARSGFGSYDFVVSFDPRGFKVENIKPGDQPFGEPAASNINNSSGKIFVNDFSDKVPGPTGNVITFYLTVTGLAAGSWPISVTVTTLSAANGEDIVGSVLPGGITVSGASAPTPAPTARPTTPLTPVVTPAPTPPPTSKPTTPPPSTKPATPPATKPPTAPPATPKPATPAPTIAPTPVPTPTPEPGPNLALIIGVIVLVIVVIVVIVLVTRKKPEPPAPPPPPAPKK